MKLTVKFIGPKNLSDCINKIVKQLFEKKILQPKFWKKQFQSNVLFHNKLKPNYTIYNVKPF